MSSLILGGLFIHEIETELGSGTYKVDFPAPLGPTTAIRESRPTSMLMPLSNTLSVVYPNVASFNCRIGGEIFSVSGNLNVSVSSASGGCNSGSYGEKELMHFLDKRRKGANLLEDLDFRLCLSSTVSIVSPSIDERL